MKMRGAKKVHYDSGPNMTPLVDVVMVILIFLMLAGKFGGEEHYLASNVPIRQKGIPVPNQVLPDTQDLKISVVKDDDHQINARLEGVDRPYFDPKSLSDALSDRLKAVVDAGKKPDDIQILISPVGNVQYNCMIQVYAAALSAEVDSGGQKLGFTKVAFEAAHN
jgi:biopolymer transport protein ExbD